MNTHCFIWAFKLTASHSEVKLSTKLADIQHHGIASNT